MHFSNDDRTKNGNYNSDKVMTVKTKTFPMLLNVLESCNSKDDRDVHDDQHITMSRPGTITTKCSADSKYNKINIECIGINLNINLFIQSLIDKSRHIIGQRAEDFMLNLQSNNNQKQDNENESSISAPVGYESPMFSSSSIDCVVTRPPLPPTHGHSARNLSIVSPLPPSLPVTSPMTNNTCPKRADATNATTCKNKHNPALVSPPL